MATRRRCVAWKARFRRFSRVSLAIVAGLTVDSIAAAEGIEAGPWPLICREASLPAATPLPRNVPAIPLLGSSLTPATTCSLVGNTETIPADISSGWLVYPSTQPSVGAYRLRYEEECSRIDGGSLFERRFHTAEIPIQFGEAAPLPTSAGSVLVSQALSDFPPDDEVVFESGQCQIRRFVRLVVSVLWTPSAELTPFIGAVTARGGWTPDANTMSYGYGLTVDALNPSIGFRYLMACYPPYQYGLVDGRGTHTVRSHLAGTPQDFAPLTVDMRLECPLSEFIGFCPDAGSDASTPDSSTDASTGDASVDDGPIIDALRGADAQAGIDTASQSDVYFDTTDSPVIDLSDVQNLDAADTSSLDAGGSSTPDSTIPDARPNSSDQPTGDGESRGCTVDRGGRCNSSRAASLVATLIFAIAFARRRGRTRDV
jgi:hypothetical protein